MVIGHATLPRVTGFPILQACIHLVLSVGHCTNSTVKARLLHKYNASTLSPWPVSTLATFCSETSVGYWEKAIEAEPSSI